MKKFKWESEEEFAYREKISNISTKTVTVLAKMPEYAKNLNYSIPLCELKEQHRNITNLVIPKMYSKAHDLLVEGYEYYIRGFEIMAKAFIDSNSKVKSSKIYKAGALIDAGTAYMNIVKCKNLELWEEKNGENNT